MYVVRERSSNLRYLVVFSSMNDNVHEFPPKLSISDERGPNEIREFRSQWITTKYATMSLVPSKLYT